MIVGSVLWQSYWLSFFYGSHSWAWFLGTRAIQFAVTSLVNAAVIFGLFKSRVFDTLHLWPPVALKEVRENDTHHAIERAVK